MQREDLGRLEDIEAITRLVEIEGRCLVDVGCGEGALARALVAHGAAQVLGIEPDAVQAEKNRAAPQSPGVRLVEADASHIPMEPGEAEGVIFSRSLHHVPIPEMGQALAEARRVLKPRGAFLLVIEPLVEGAFSRLIEPFNDERVPRAKAYQAMRALVPELFAAEREAVYTNDVSFPDFAAFVARVVGATYNRIRAEDVETPEVRRRFEAGRRGEAYVFDHPMRVNLFFTG